MFILFSPSHNTSIWRVFRRSSEIFYENQYNLCRVIYNEIGIVIGIRLCSNFWLLHPDNDVCTFLWSFFRCLKLSRKKKWSYITIELSNVWNVNRFECLQTETQKWRIIHIWWTIIVDITSESMRFRLTCR